MLGTVQNAREAVNWLGYTYLYVRMLRNPSLYGASEDERDRPPARAAADRPDPHGGDHLDKCALIKYERKSGQFQPTDLGRVAAYYYVSHSDGERVQRAPEADAVGHRAAPPLRALEGLCEHLRARGGEGELARLIDRVPIPIKENGRRAEREGERAAPGVHLAPEARGLLAAVGHGVRHAVGLRG